MAERDAKIDRIADRLSGLEEQMDEMKELFIGRAPGAKCVICGEPCEMRAPFPVCPTHHQTIQKWEAVKKEYRALIERSRAMTGERQRNELEDEIADLLVTVMTKDRGPAAEAVAAAMYRWFDEGTGVAEWSELPEPTKKRWRRAALRMHDIMMMIRTGVQG